MSCCKEKSSCINIYCCGNEGSDQISQAEPLRNQFYVSANNGSDKDGDGTREKPWKTILYAIDLTTSSKKTKLFMKSKKKEPSE